jgi:hypothetical protein
MTMPFTDHHLQDKIIAALVDDKKRFSDLVPEGLEHSLFMYHMKKLIKEGIVKKDGQHYELTINGAQQYNGRHRTSEPLRQPSLLIQFLVLSDDKVLLSRRTTSLNKSLNEYMLPGGNHFFLSPSRSSATSVAKTRGLIPGDFLFTVETIVKDMLFHGLIDVYAATLKSESLKKTKEYELVWLPVSELKSMTFSQAGSAPFIVSASGQESLSKRFTNIV